MSSDKYDAFLICFNGKNYAAKAFHFKIFVKGKDLWGRVDDIKHTPKKDKNKDECSRV